MTGRFVLAALLTALLFAGLLGAALIGQRNQCARLTDAGSARAAQVCGTDGGQP